MRKLWFLFVCCLLQLSLCSIANSTDVSNVPEEIDESTPNTCNLRTTKLMGWHFPFSPDIIWDASKYLLKFPYLADMAIKAINIICTAAQHISSQEPHFVPNIAKLHYVLTNGAKFPLNKPEAVWSESHFNSNLPTVLVITGWLTDNKAPNPALIEISNAYKCRGGYNFVSVDTGGLLSNLYIWSSFNTEVVGEAIAESLAHLSQNKTYPVEKIHVVGHSLGAQIAGSIGRHFFKITNVLLERITGLDPARPCFNEGERLTGLFRGDAAYVDVIHTNNNILGKRDPIGDADFYPNGVTALQPGCFSSAICSHMRAPTLFAESVYPGYENNFLSVRCSSIAALDNDHCKEKPISMGFAAPKGAKGTFMLRTKSEKPFGEYAPLNTPPVCVDGFEFEGI